MIAATATTVDPHNALIIAFTPIETPITARYFNAIFNIVPIELCVLILCIITNTIYDTIPAIIPKNMLSLAAVATNPPIQTAKNA